MIRPQGKPIGSGQAPSSEAVRAICSRVLEGGEASASELADTLEVEPGTEQAAILRSTELALARRGNGGVGYVFAQIGIDASPCPGNCHFCDFAVCNHGVAEGSETPWDEVMHCCELFSRNGVHLLSLMSSASYPFARYVELVRQVRDVAGADVAIMANTRDLSLDEARRLKEAGADCIYHAVRLGEGRITGFGEDDRWQTIDNAAKAGLGVFSGVGPVYQSPSSDSIYFQTKEQIVDRMVRLSGMDLMCTGVTGLHAIPGTLMEGVRPFSSEKRRIIGAVLQLALRGSARYGGGGSIHWVDAGLDPRSRGYKTDDAHLLKRIGEARGQLIEENWRPAGKMSLA